MIYQGQQIDLITRPSWDWMTEMELEQLPRFETRY
jgi:hypothetical protein